MRYEDFADMTPVSYAVDDAGEKVLICQDSAGNRQAFTLKDLEEVRQIVKKKMQETPGFSLNDNVFPIRK